MNRPAGSPGPLPALWTLFIVSLEPFSRGQGGDQACVREDPSGICAEWGTGPRGGWEESLGWLPASACWGGGEEALVNLRVALGVKQAGLVTQNVVDQSPPKMGRSRFRG